MVERVKVTIPPPSCADFLWPILQQRLSVMRRSLIESRVEIARLRKQLAEAKAAQAAKHLTSKDEYTETRRRRFRPDEEADIMDAIDRYNNGGYL